MNLLYVAFIREDSEAVGFLKKVISQCKVFSNFYTTYLFISRKDRAVLYKISNDNKTEIESFKYKSFFEYKSNVDSLKNIRSYFRFSYFYNLVTFIQKKYNVHISYFRSTIPLNPLIKAIKKGKKNKIINIYEYPTYPYEEEYKKIIGSIKYNLIWKKGLVKIENLVDLIVGITAQKEIILKNKKNKLVLITNGIDIKSTKIKNRVSIANEKKVINLLSVANINNWHGFDRIIKGLYEYYKNDPKIKIYYHCVGEGRELENLKKLTKELNIEKYVIFHGTKTGKELDKLFDIADIGIGSLGMYRISLQYGATLKLREYCARGLPFVYGYDDIDFENFRYSLRVSNDNSSINVNNIIEFYESIKNENYTEEMRKYAEKNLTWEVKMKPVIDRINNILRKKELK